MFITQKFDGENESTRKISSKFMKLLKDKDGYLTIGLVKEQGQKQKRFRVHRLVAITFIENPNKKPFINHKNAVKNDNRVSNLEWCTAKENTKHARELGLQSRINKGCFKKRSNT